MIIRLTLQLISKTVVDTKLSNAHSSATTLCSRELRSIFGADVFNFSKLATGASIKSHKTNAAATDSDKIAVNDEKSVTTRSKASKNLEKH